MSEGSTQLPSEAVRPTLPSDFSSEQLGSGAGHIFEEIVEGINDGESDADDEGLIPGVPEGAVRVDME